jgi:hypothetical protein
VLNLKWNFKNISMCETFTAHSLNLEGAEYLQVIASVLLKYIGERQN